MTLSDLTESETEAKVPGPEAGDALCICDGLVIGSVVGMVVGGTDCLSVSLYEQSTGVVSLGKFNLREVVTSRLCVGYCYCVQCLTHISLFRSLSLSMPSSLSLSLSLSLAFSLPSELVSKTGRTSNSCKR